MSAIKDIRCVLTQKALDAFCDKFHIPEEVHPVLPNHNDTMHKRPAGKIGFYTRFLDDANFRLPLSTFLVDVLRHFRINISQLSVIRAAKVSHFEILCRVYGIIPTVGLFRCFYVNSKKSGCMSFSKCSDNDLHVTRVPDPVAADFKRDYATLVAHPSPFLKFPEAFLCLVGLSRYYPLDGETYPRFLHKNREGGCRLLQNVLMCFAALLFCFKLCPFRKFPEAFLCLVGLSRHYTLDEETYPRFLHKNGEEINIFAFIHTLDPTKVRVLVAPKRAESELEASVERLFDEGGSGNHTEQGDSVVGEQNANIRPVVEAADTVVEVVDPMQPRRQRKRKSVVVDACGASHHPKKLREDHGTPSGASVGGKSRSAIKRLLAGVVLNVEVGVAAIPNLPFVRASISSTPEREDGDHTDSVAEPNLRTIGASQRFFISLDSSHHSGPTIAEADIAGGTDPNTGVFLDLTGSDFPVGGTRTVIDPDTNLQKMVDEFAPLKFFASVRGMKHDQLFTEFNVGAARQMYLSAEVRMRAENNVKERRRLKSVIEKQDELLKARDGEIEDLKAQLLLKEIEAAEATCLRAQTSNLEAVEKSLRDAVNALKERNTILEKEWNALDVKVRDLEVLVVGKERDLTDLNAQLTYVKFQNNNLVDRVHELEISSAGLREKVTVDDNCMEKLEKFQDDRMKVVNDKFDKLYTDFVKMTLYLEEKFYPHLLTTISRTAIVKCLNSLEYLSALGTSIGK
ncbi:hypothetical protein Tco_0819958 [Tanacetum coccineum]|uniref:Transposase (putative) gypsy type domain-containing protein n=1 Tax=Tanacetum coccineum TaxID=301880 RepID=A0ABQ5A9T4_9ASTR